MKLILAISESVGAPSMGNGMLRGGSVGWYFWREMKLPDPTLDDNEREAFADALKLFTRPAQSD